jgi:hypothetical protein
MKNSTLEDPFFIGLTESPVENIIAITRAIISLSFEYLQPDKADKKVLGNLQGQFEFLVGLYESHEIKRREADQENISLKNGESTCKPVPPFEVLSLFQKINFIVELKLRGSKINPVSPDLYKVINAIAALHESKKTTIVMVSDDNNCFSINFEMQKGESHE